MHYLIFYNGEFVAYTDDKNIKNDFITIIDKKEKVVVDKFKKMSDELLDHMDIMDNTLYYEPLTNIPVSENILDAMSIEVQELTPYLIGHYDRLYMSMHRFKLTEEESSTLKKFFDMYNDILQDCEFLYTEYYSIPKLLNDFILPSLKQHHL